MWYMLRFHLMFGVCIAGHSSEFDCVRDCFGELSTSMNSGSNITCEMLHRAMSCHDNNTEACASVLPLQLGFHLNVIQTELRERNCVVTTMSPTVATQPPVMITCPSVPIQVDDLFTPAPDIVPEGNIPGSCRVTGTSPVSHCR